MNAQQLILIIIASIGGVLALVGLFRPFLGLIVLVAMHYVQPGELFPALDPLHLERTYALALLAAFVLYRMSQKNQALSSNKIVQASVLLVGAACLSVPFAVWRGGAFWQMVELIKNVILLVLIAGLVDTKGRMKKLLLLQVVILAWFAGSGFIAYRHGIISFQEGTVRAEGINSMGGSPNELAGVILAGMPFLIALFRTSRNILARFLLMACAALGVWTLVLTGSRASLIAFVILIAYYVAHSKHKVTWALLSVAFLVGGWLMMPAQYQMRFSTIERYASGGRLDSSNELRLRVWKAGVRMFLDHPILGVGAGQFRTAYGTTYSGRLHTAWMSPHNLLLQVACELGVVGLIIFVYFVVQIVKELRAVLRMRDHPDMKVQYELAVACQAMLVAVLAVSVVGHTLYRPYWYLLGGLAAANYLNVTQALGKLISHARDRGKATERYEDRLVSVDFPDRVGI
jgi:O-antigen ligase